MIKVVIPGHKYYETTCGMCGCVFRFEDEDIESKEDISDRGITWATHWTLTCPCCNNKVTLTDQQARKTWLDQFHEE